MLRICGVRSSTSAFFVRLFSRLQSGHREPEARDPTVQKPIIMEMTLILWVVLRVSHVGQMVVLGLTQIDA